MSLASGARLGAYEIVSLLGVGGMGEVYKARDTALGRHVALKTLPASVTHDPERLARFRREAQLLAALNHPHIAGIYGVEETDGQRFLVLELVEGQTLAARLDRGPLPVEEALGIAQEIAEALEAAHEKGIVHRDLKPANIALTPQDRVKVLDFGLARATEAGPASGDPLNSPTITSPATLTALGVVLGTAAYMSPEQAKGRVADKRSDVWSFGCVLYEMLAGRRAFKGDDVSDTIAAVLRSEPDWTALPPSVPPAVRALLEGCLAKRHRDRISDLSAARFVLQQPVPASQNVQPAAVAPARSRWAPALFLVAGLAAGAAVTAIAWPRAQTAALPVTRFTIALPEGAQFTQSRRVVAISPDGTRIVYTADGRLHMRALADFQSRPIPGADPGIHPAFSPDGRSIAFWADFAVKRMSVEGGVPVTICQTSPAPFGLRWTEHGIVFVQPGVGVMRISPNGGKVEELVKFGPSDGLAHGAELLPTGQTIIFTLASLSGFSSNAWDEARIVAQSLRDGTRTTLVEGGSDAHYLDSGHLVYMFEGTLMAVPFDAVALKVTGGAVPVVEGIRRTGVAVGGAAHFAVSRNGVLAYVPGPARGGQDDVFLYDRKGGIQPLKLPRGRYSYPRASHDGKWIVYETSDGKNAVVAIYELSGASSARRLTFGGNNRLPIWSRDGRHVVFQSDRDGDRALFRQPVDGGPAERLTRPHTGVTHVAEAWSPTEDVFLFSATKENETSLWIYSMRDRKASPFADVRSIGLPTNAIFSPDGKWVAYQTGDGTVAESITHVQPYPATGSKFEIGRGGRAVWSKTNEMFFVPGPSLFRVVTLSTAPSFSFTSPVDVPRRFGLAPPANPRPYDLLPDGRFVAVDASETSGAGRSPVIHVVLNWFEELKSKTQ